MLSDSQMSKRIKQKLKTKEMFWGVIYKRCVRTKRGLKLAYATFKAKVVIYKKQT